MSKISINKAKTMAKTKGLSSIGFKVRSTQNNTFVTVTDVQGNVIKSYSCGKLGLKGSRKKANTAFSMVVNAAAADVKLLPNLPTIMLGATNLQSGVSSIFPTLAKHDLASRVVSICAQNSVAHGGVRMRREKRK